MRLFPHQKEALDALKPLNKVALYWDMGLGKTYGGSEKLHQLGEKANLVICQKSKLSDWMDHFKTHYDYKVLDLTKPKELTEFCGLAMGQRFYTVGVVNYDLVFRRPELLDLRDFTLMLDESSLIQNEGTKRSKFILKLQPKNVILLSGTPVNGKYEKLWSQLHLLGWQISKRAFYSAYVDYHYETYMGFPMMVIDGYKNVERLKRKMRAYGCHFLKTEEVLDLPDQIFTSVGVGASKEYRKFRKDRVVEVDGTQLVGDNTLTKMLYERQLCGQYSKSKLEAFKDLLESTEDRLIVFYNFTAELEALMEIAVKQGKPYSVVNGNDKNLINYERCNNSVTFIQYQAGAMGLNLQLANKVIYFTPPLSSELFEQSKKRVHRIGQKGTCYYYYLTVKRSIEERIYKTLALRRDYTNQLFELEEADDA